MSFLYTSIWASRPIPSLLSQVNPQHEWHGSAVGPHPRQERLTNTARLFAGHGLPKPHHAPEQLLFHIFSSLGGHSLISRCCAAAPASSFSCCRAFPRKSIRFAVNCYPHYFPLIHHILFIFLCLIIHMNLFFNSSPVHIKSY